MIFLDLFAKLKTKNALWKEKEISLLLKNHEKVLDFGCGDLLFAGKLKERNKTLRITGIDVVDAHRRRNIRFVKYRGNKLPFKNNSFDTVISIYVFHHCKDAEDSFKECLRVGKRVIFIEAIAKSKLEIIPMKFMDWIYNVWKPEPIPLTFQFYKMEKWKNIFKKNKLKLNKEKEIKNIMSRLPIGKTYIFEVNKKTTI